MVVLVVGLPGTGKTTVARLLAERIGGELLSADAVRKEIVPVSRYSRAEGHRVRDEVLERTVRAVAAGRHAVVDGVFGHREQRDRFRAAAADAGVGFHLVEVTAPEALVRTRLDARTGDASDATFELYARLKRHLAPVDEPRSVLVNDGDLAAVRARVESLELLDAGRQEHA